MGLKRKAQDEKKKTKEIILLGNRTEEKSIGRKGGNQRIHTIEEGKQKKSIGRKAGNQRIHTIKKESG